MPAGERLGDGPALRGGGDSVLADRRGGVAWGCVGCRDMGGRLAAAVVVLWGMEGRVEFRE